MSQEICQSELQEKTQKLLQGPLKHIRAAALAAALLPLASVAAAPAAAQDACQSGGICGCRLPRHEQRRHSGCGRARDRRCQSVRVTIVDGSEEFQTLDRSRRIYSTAPSGHVHDRRPDTAGKQPSPGTTVGDAHR